MRPVRHKQGCKGDDSDAVIWRGVRDWMATCALCDRTTPLCRVADGDPRRPEPVKSKPKPEMPTTSSARYLCRDHGEPVDHRGRGCRACGRSS